MDQPIPRGIELLVKKAAVDADFRELLLDQRDAAADAIGLRLDAAESLMLRAAPREQVESIIGRTRVAPGLRKVLMSGAAALMLAALGTSTVSCERSVVTGSAPDLPEERGAATEVAGDSEEKSDESCPVTEDGARPDRLMEAPGGARPDDPSEDAGADE